MSKAGAGKRETRGHNMVNDREGHDQHAIAVGSSRLRPINWIGQGIIAIVRAYAPLIKHYFFDILERAAHLSIEQQTAIVSDLNNNIFRLQSSHRRGHSQT